MRAKEERFKTESAVLLQKLAIGREGADLKSHMIRNSRNGSTI